MDHTIKEKKFCITGKLSLYDRPGVEDAITRAGGLVAKSVGPKTDFLVVGARAGSKLAKAKKLGIPVIEEADLKAFLAGEVVEVDEQVVASGDASMRDLVGEARGVLDGEHDSSTWSSILEIVDACAPDQLAGLIDYLAPQIARWNPGRDDRWLPEPKSHGVEDSTGSWRRRSPKGEVRMAPWSWLVEMVSGHSVLKHVLIHGIHVDGFDANARIIKELLSSEHLTNLRLLDVADAAISSVFWRALRTAESTRSLEVLRIKQPPGKSMKGMGGKHHLDDLRHLVVEATLSDAKTFAEFLSSEIFSGVTTLTMEHSWPVDALRKLGDEVMPDLTTLEYDFSYIQHVPHALAHPFTARVGKLALIKRIHLKPDVDPADTTATLLPTFTEWTEGVDSGPAHLDIARVHVLDDNEHASHETYQDLHAKLAESWHLPDGVTTLSVGRAWSEELAQVWAERGVTATP